MSFYRTCPHCGAHLDPGEACDCRGALLEEARSRFLKLKDEQTKKLLYEVARDARRDLPGDFEGKSDEEIILEIAVTVRRAQKAGLLEDEL